MSTSPYFNTGGKPQLLPSFCVYMDVLGFVDRTEAAYRSKASAALFNEFYDAITAAMAHLSGQSLWQTKVFTDNVILGLPHKMDSENEFGAITYDVCHYQREMANRGFFVRGALTLGELHVSESVVFGEALLEAYRLESTKARDPRIILSPDSMKLVHHHVRAYSDAAESPQNAYIFVDSDEQAFLNYLGTTIEEEAGELVADWNEVGKHKQQVEKNLAAYHAEPTIWAKYNAVANYHNFFCDEAAHLDGYTPDVKVKSPYHRTSPRRLFTPDA